MTDLLNCPFCGGAASIRTDTAHSTACLIGCAKIGCFGYEQWEETEDEAIAAWNRRATPTALAASPEVAALIREAEARGMERAVEYIAAIERLAASAGIASCTCLIKTPDITFHAANCRYVKLQYIIAQCEDFRDSAEAAALRGEKEPK